MASATPDGDNKQICYGAIETWCYYLFIYLFIIISSWRMWTLQFTGRHRLYCSGLPLLFV